MEEDLGLQPKPDEKLVALQEGDGFRSAVYRFFELLILPIAGFFLHFIVPDVDKMWALALFGGYIFLALGYVVYVERWRKKKRDFRTQSRQLREKQREFHEKQRLINSAREGELFLTGASRIAQRLREIGIETLKLEQRPIFQSDSHWAEKKWNTLNDICEILKNDRRKYGGPSDYFKATLFRVVSNDVLELDANCYPPGDFPNTEKICRSERPNATAFLCLDNKSAVVIPDVPTEALKDKRIAKWVELYEDQAKHYGSMICVPITIGERTAHTHKVVAILTIDTNRINYFSDKEQEKALMFNLLVPFRYYLSFIYLAASDIS